MSLGMNCTFHTIITKYIYTYYNYVLAHISSFSPLFFWIQCDGLNGIVCLVYLLQLIDRCMLILLLFQ